MHHGDMPSLATGNWSQGVRILLVGAASDWSINDVSDAYHNALKRANHDVYFYSLNNRLKMVGAWFKVMKDGAYCLHCGGETLSPWPEFRGSLADTIEAASICVVHEAVRQRSELVMVISGCSWHPNANAFLQQVGIPVVTIFTECPYADDAQRDLARTSTLVTTNERTSAATYDAVARANGGEGAIYLPTAYDSETHIPGPSEPDKQCDVFFCGTGFDERVRFFKAVDWTDIDLRVAGFWLPDATPKGDNQVAVQSQLEADFHMDRTQFLDAAQGGEAEPLARYIISGPLPNAEVVRWYRSAKIVLSLHREHPTAESFAVRVYEAAAVGAFQVADDCRRAEIEEVFGDAIPMFRTGDPEHLRFVLDYYLARPGLRGELAVLARERVQGHSYDDRLDALMRAILARQAPPVRLLRGA